MEMGYRQMQHLHFIQSVKGQHKQQLLLYRMGFTSIREAWLEIHIQQSVYYKLQMCARICDMYNV